MERGENQYIWRSPEWPQLVWDDAQLLAPLATARLKQGRLLGGMARLGFDLKLAAQLEALTEEVIKSSEIEGEMLQRDSVRSSIARRLGVPAAVVAPSHRRTEGVVDMMLDATENYDASLTPERLFGWQAAIGNCSIPTAQRDINELLERSILRRNPGGSKNTSYELATAP